MSLPAAAHPRASAALAVVGLTTQIAFAGTDGIPIVKQIVGVAARIVTLAQDIEARRDALHTLVENARGLARTVAAVTSDREIEGEILVRLEALHCVLRSIETLLSEHTAKTRFQRALSYAFSVQKHIDRLRHELSCTLNEFLLVAALDTNNRVKDSARCIGKFRVLRDFEVDKLELVAEEAPQGYCPLMEIADRADWGFGQAFSRALKVVDAARYLEDMGAAWNPESERHVFVDDAGRPTIGLRHDLCPFTPDATNPYYNQLVQFSILINISFPWEKTHAPVQLVNELFPDFPLGDIFNVCESIWTAQHVVPRNLLASHLVSQKTATYLQKIMTRLDARPHRGLVVNHASIVLRPFISSVAMGTFFYAKYWVYGSHEDRIAATKKRAT
ncbi:hypothetical protein AURDEDRAFT_164188 [Auricularia subglabra TFB-10046 SS5]|nr:hypothetical protein AURDEDRAFT_164188 [Auricularia subglabra TFB-10046 SS5]